MTVKGNIDLLFVGIYVGAIIILIAIRLIKTIKENVDN